MLTHNFFKVLTSTLSFTASPTNFKPVDLTGVAFVAYVSSSKSPSGYFSSYSFRLNDTDGIIVGRGKTPATKDDYCLEDRITAGISQESRSISTNRSLDYYEVVYTLSLRNTTSEDITINEIGYVASVLKSSSESGYTLFDRTILDTPLTIPAGDAKSLSYSIRINWPT